MLKRDQIRVPIFDRIVFPLLLAGAALLAGKGWLDAHPQHNPWAPLDLSDPDGWATARKIASLRAEPALCRDVLARSSVEFRVLEPAGTGACARPDRTRLVSAPLAPDVPSTTCAVAAAVSRWVEKTVRPAAEAELGTSLSRIEHFGAYSCRRLYSRGEGPWSEHATGNAIDIAAFVLADGRRVSILRDWPGQSAEARFLRRVRDGACNSFGTVLSPDYNAAHRDHFHLDQASRGLGGVCR